MQAVQKLESSMIHLCKARLSMLGALQQRFIPYGGTKYDPFLPTLKGLQHCLLRRYTLQTQHSGEISPSTKVQTQTPIERPDTICREFIEQHPRMDQNIKENLEFNNYIHQLGTYTKEKETILQLPKTEKEKIPNQPPATPSFTESSPWSPPPPSPSSPPPETDEDSSYNWLPSGDPFLTQRSVPFPPPPISSARDHTPTPRQEESEKLPSTGFYTDSDREPIGNQTTEAPTPPPWIAPSLQGNRSPGKRTHTSSSPHHFSASSHSPPHWQG